MSDETVGINPAVESGSAWGEPVPPAPLSAPQPAPTVDATHDSRPGGGSKRTQARTSAGVGDQSGSPATSTATRTRPGRPDGQPTRTLYARDTPLRPRIEAPPVPEPLRVSRKQRRRVRIVERFSGHRVRARVGVWRRIRSVVFLIVIGAILAAVVAAILAAAVAGIALALHHLSKS